MKQSLHILKKDISYLRYDIAITLLAVLAFTFAATRGIGALDAFLPVTWWFLIARVIHAEALPGHRQFWVTRPYDWRSLLGAKLLFILIFVNLPLLIADMVIVHAAGFSASHEIPGLLWAQVLLMLAFVLPAAAFSAITSGMGQLLFMTLLLVIGMLALLIFGSSIHWGSPWFQLEWVRTDCLLTQLAAVAAIVLLWQYARRNTFGTRVLAGASALVLVATGSLLPWNAAFALQTRISPTNISPTSIRIALDLDRKWLGQVYATGHDRIVADLPLQITGIPAGTILRPNGLALRLIAPDGETWVANQPPPDSFDSEAGITSLRLAMGRAFYTKVRDEPLELRGRLFFTLYGNEQSVSIPLDGRPVRVNHVLCSAGAHFLHCDSVFRTPIELIAARIVQNSPGGPKTTTKNPFPNTSYSPFPADLRVNPLYQSFFSPYAETISDLYIDAFEPLAYQEQDFKIDHVRLHDFPEALH
ncbi:MAG TPA: hypothetical protein VHZ07_06500 [Bryobacteraceae bacterium]|jgi:hypothetical protein|nr:hypothetical protein [Bryobacteraceae bacterium]